MAVLYQAISAGSAAWPAGHQADDIGLVVIKTDHATDAPSVNQGFTELFSGYVAGSSQDRSVRLSLWWKRAASGSETTPTVSVTSGTLYYSLMTVRGAVTSGTPFHIQVPQTVTTQMSLATDYIVAQEPPDEPYVPNGLIIVAAAVANEDSPIDCYAVNVDGGGSDTIRQNQTNQIAIVTAIPNFDLRLGTLIYQTFGGGDTLNGVIRMLLMAPPSISSPFSSDGISAAAFIGQSTFSSTLSSSGTSTAAFVGASKFSGVMSAAGVGTATAIGNGVNTAVMNAAGTSIGSFVSAGDSGSPGSATGSSTAAFIGAASALAIFGSHGESQASAYAPDVIEGVFSAAGTSTAQFESASVTVATRSHGSTGAVDGEVILDWSILDFADITLEPGDGVYSIEHTNLIPGKRLNVAVTNSGASGTLIWDDGDAAVDWGPPGEPAMPADGETLHVEFFARSLSEILGRHFWT